MGRWESGYILGFIKYINDYLAGVVFYYQKIIFPFYDIIILF